MTATDELRGKCRTCRYLATNEGNVSSGYCWQSDKPIALRSYETFPEYLDPDCPVVLGEDSVWEPTGLLEPYFAERADDD